nr:PREDICTED: asparagine-rich protein-like [Bemisia tabaci]
MSRQLGNGDDKVEEINFRLRRALAERVMREQELMQKIEHLQSDLCWRSDEFLNLKIDEILSTHFLRPEDIMKLSQDSVLAAVKNEMKTKQSPYVSGKEKSCTNNQTSENLFPQYTPHSIVEIKDEKRNNLNATPEQISGQSRLLRDLTIDEPMEEEETYCNPKTNSDSTNYENTSNKIMTNKNSLEDNHSKVSFANDEEKKKSIWELVEFFEVDKSKQHNDGFDRQTKNRYKLETDENDQKLLNENVREEGETLDSSVNSSSIIHGQDTKSRTLQGKVDVDRTNILTEADEHRQIPLNKLTNNSRTFEKTYKQVEIFTTDSVELHKQHSETVTCENHLKKSGMFKAFPALLEEPPESVRIEIPIIEPVRGAQTSDNIEKENDVNKTENSTPLNNKNCCEELTRKKPYNHNIKNILRFNLEQSKEDDFECILLEEFILKLNGLVKTVEGCLKLQKKIQVHLLQTIRNFDVINMSTDRPETTKNRPILETKKSLQNPLGDDFKSNCVNSTTRTPHLHKSPENAQPLDGENNEVHTQHHTAENKNNEKHLNDKRDISNKRNVNDTTDINNESNIDATRDVNDKKDVADDRNVTEGGNVNKTRDINNKGDGVVAGIQDLNSKNYQYEILRQKVDNLWKYLKIIEANLKYQDAIFYYLEACVQKKIVHASLTKGLDNDFLPEEAQRETSQTSKLEERFKQKKQDILPVILSQDNESFLRWIQKVKTNKTCLDGDFGDEVVEKFGSIFRNLTTTSLRDNESKFKNFNSDYPKRGKIPSKPDEVLDDNRKYKDTQEKCPEELVTNKDFLESKKTIRAPSGTILKMIHKMEKDIDVLETWMANIDIEQKEETIFGLLKKILINRQRLLKYLATCESKNEN